MRSPRWRLVVAAAVAVIGGWAGVGASPAGAATFNDLFVSAPASVTGSYVPLPGDFDCDGTSQEVLWYAAGTATDHLWEITGAGPGGVTRVSTPLSIVGAYQPFTGDWDGDGCDDVFWYAPGAAKDYVWYFESDLTWQSEQVSVTGTYVPTYLQLTAGVGGVHWYAPGGGIEYLWQGSPTRGQFDSSIAAPLPVTDIRPSRIGDIDGLPGGSMLLHRPGNTPDLVIDDLLFGTTQTDSYPADIDGTHQPLFVSGVVPRVLLYGPGSEPDELWGQVASGLGGASAAFDTLLPGSIIGTYTARGSADGTLLVFHAPGAPTDYVWFLD